MKAKNGTALLIAGLSWLYCFGYTLLESGLHHMSAPVLLGLLVPLAWCLFRYLDLKRVNVVYLLFWIYEILIHTAFSNMYADDLVYGSFAVNSPSDIISYLIFYYNNYMSRIIPLFLTIAVFTRIPLCFWRAADCAVLVFIASVAADLIRKDDRTDYAADLLVCMGLAVYPISQMYSCGWVTGTIFYLWPFSMALYSFLPVSRLYKGRDVSHCVKYYAAIALAAFSQEQIAGFSAIVFAYAMIRYRRSAQMKKIVPEFLLCILGCVFFLTCPGQALRQTSDALAFFPDYLSWTLRHKVFWGIETTVLHFFEQDNMIFTCFIASIAVGALIRAKHRGFDRKTLAAVLPVFILASSRVMSSVYDYQSWICVYDYGFGAKNLAAMAGQLVFIAAVVSGLSCLFRSREERDALLWLLVLLLAGAASRAVMGFSPTIYASGTRTFMVFYMVILFVTVIVVKEKILSPVRDPE